ncbi:transferase [Colletotrichum falcatum]|nr:transferase [Colletotrichum falcatum]
MPSAIVPLEVEIKVVKAERVFPQTPPPHEQAIPLSLLDATLTNFAHTNAVWVFEPLIRNEMLDVDEHLRQTLRTTLKEAKDFPLHARRFGRIYTRFGTATDAGVEFISATSSATTNSLYLIERAAAQPLWDRKDDNFGKFVPPSDLAHALYPNEPNTASGLRKPIMAIQSTRLSDGGFVLAIKTAHPLADITALVRFVKDWASVSRAVVEGLTYPVLPPVFEPALLDNLAAGDINAEEPDPTIIRRTESLPLHRYDWWAAPGKLPAAFLDTAKPVPPAGKPIPWAEWDLEAPVSDYTIHLNKDQVDFLWTKAMKGTETNSPRITKHDAVLAHIWSCIMRARQLGIGMDDGPVYCNLALGVRSAFNLGEAFVGSPIMMMKVELPYSQVSCVESGNATGPIGYIAREIRDTISRINNPSSLADHLHSVAYEKSPQRIWQAFLGRRHIVVTTWARAGLYDIDFGLGSRVRYADSVVPNLDSSIVIKEAPPSPREFLPGTRPSWTDSGVDISVHIATDDMERLLKDPLLLPLDILMPIF